MILKQKADLAASFQRIKDILHSAGEKSVTSGSTTETVQQTTEPSKSTSQTLPKQMKTASVNYSFVGTGVLVAATYGIIRKNKKEDGKVEYLEVRLKNLILECHYMSHLSLVIKTDVPYLSRGDSCSTTCDHQHAIVAA